MQGQQSSTSIFESNNYTSKLCEKLLASSENGQFSDICLIASDDMKFHAHKCVLTACSQYFTAMFGGGLKEASSREVKIHEVNGKVLKPILTFLYTGQIELQNEIIEDILTAADFFQMKPLTEVCYNFMFKKLDAKNCLGITMFADQHGYLELFNKASKFASGMFETISNEPEFLKLDENQLSAIVSSKNLCVTSEEKVFFNLIKWIEHDKLIRQSCALKLFSKIRYWLLSPDFIMKHKGKLPHDVDCLAMISSWLDGKSSPIRRLKEQKFRTAELPLYELLLVGGGKIQTYNTKLNSWTHESFSNLPHTFNSVVGHKNKLIFSCSDPHSIICFNLQTHKVTNLPRISSETRKYFCMAVLNDELYIIRGNSRIVDKYNFSTGKWYNVAPMNTLFSSFSPKAAVADGMLYVVGDAYNDNIFHMDIFNPATNNWLSKNIHKIPKYEFGFTGVGGILYAYNRGYNSFESVQIIDALSYSWTVISRMEFGLHQLQCVCWNNRLVTYGCFDGPCTRLNMVQEYDPTLNLWKTLDPLIEKKSSHKYALVSFQ